MIQGIASFPGVQFVSGATFSVTHGISPSVCALEIAPQPDVLAETGTLAFDFGGVHIEWPDCKVDYGSLEWNGRGQIVRLNILDRRWKWAFGMLAGTYNLYRADGEVVPDTEKTPAELATLCLEAMGEANFDVGDLPADPRIEVRWDWDVPADALARLCDTLGYRVVLQANNRVAIRKLGVGADLPDGAIQENTVQINPPELPDELAIVGAPARYQDDLLLEAVGIDSDAGRTVRPIDDLAYKPSGGWASEQPAQFSNVAAQFGNVASELARQSVFRMYRIVYPATVRGYPLQLKDIDHLIVTAEQVETFVDAEGLTQNKPAQVLGQYYRWGDQLANTAAGTVYGLDFSLDTGTGTVTFQDPVVRTTSTTSLAPAAAILYLRTAYSVLVVGFRAPRRTVHKRATGGNHGTPTAYYERPELAFNYVDGARQNEQEVVDEANLQLDAIEASLQTQTPVVRRYAGLVPATLDGAVQHAVYVVGPQGCTTTLSRDTEQREYVIPFKRRRLLEQQRAEQSRAMLARILRELA